jgi:hypothetical protein
VVAVGLHIAPPCCDGGGIRGQLWKNRHAYYRIAIISMCCQGHSIVYPNVVKHYLIEEYDAQYAPQGVVCFTLTRKKPKPPTLYFVAFS